VFTKNGFITSEDTLVKEEITLMISSILTSQKENGLRFKLLINQISELITPLLSSMGFYTSTGVEMSNEYSQIFIDSTLPLKSGSRFQPTFKIQNLDSDTLLSE